MWAASQAHTGNVEGKKVLLSLQMKTPLPPVSRSCRYLREPFIKAAHLPQQCYAVFKDTLFFFFLSYCLPTLFTLETLKVGLANLLTFDGLLDERSGGETGEGE